MEFCIDEDPSLSVGALGCARSGSGWHRQAVGNCGRGTARSRLECATGGDHSRRIFATSARAKGFCCAPLRHAAKRGIGSSGRSFATGKSQPTGSDLLLGAFAVAVGGCHQNLSSQRAAVEPPSPYASRPSNGMGPPTGRWSDRDLARRAAGLPTAGRGRRGDSSRH